MDPVRAAFFERRWRHDAKAVLALSVARIREILPELISRDCHQILIAIPKINIDFRVRLVLVPNPAIDFIAVGPLNFADMMRQWRSANASRKNEQSEANKVECYKDSCGAPGESVAPTLSHSVQVRKNMERREQGRLVETINDIMRLRPVP